MTPSFEDKRPLSPHLQIYKLQITSLLSSLHRGTGIVLYAGALLWTLWFVALAAGPESYQHLLGRYGRCKLASRKRYHNR